MKWHKAFITVGVAFSALVICFAGGKGLRSQPLDTVWQNIGQPLQAENLRMIVIDPLDQNKAYLATERGLLVTDDTGKNWNEVLDLSAKKIEVSPDMTPSERAALSGMGEKKGAVSGATSIAIDPSNPSSLFVGSPEGLYKSEDGGVSWNTVNSGFSGKSQTITGIAISSSNPDIVYASTIGGLMKSSDAGKSWKSAGVANPVNCVAIHPFNPDMVYAGVLGGAKKTEDGGAVWVDLVAGPDELSVSSIATDSLDPKVLFFGTDRGLYKSADEGMSWSKLGLAGSVDQVAVSPADSTLVYAATSGGIFGSTDSGQNWTDLSDGIPSGPGKALAFDPIDRDRLWVVAGNDVFLGSTAGSAPAVTGQLAAAPEEAPGQVEDTGAAEEASAVETLPAETVPAAEAATAPAAEPVVETVPIVETVPVAAVEEQLGPPVPTMDDVKTVLSQFAYEPTVQEIQEVAMRFAEVHPDKIEAWRRGAKWQAFLPDLKLKFKRKRADNTWDQLTWEHDENQDWDSDFSTYLDQNFDNTMTLATADSRIGTAIETSTDTDRNYELRRKHERKKENEVEIEMKWKLGDFLYSKAQVDIADEAVEETEYRNEVLEQVTQFYFQRRQFQVDLLLSPPEDLRERIRMEIQLQEMTANIDYLSGGYMTARINEARFGKQAQEEGFVRGLFRR